MSVALQLVNSLNKVKEYGLEVQVIHNDDIIIANLLENGFVIDRRSVETLEELIKELDHWLWLYEPM